MRRTSAGQRSVQVCWGYRLEKIVLLCTVISVVLLVIFSLVPSENVSVTLGAEEFVLHGDTPSVVVKTSQSSSFGASETGHIVAPPKLRIAIVGDSLSRYMYLSLCFYLKHGKWAPQGHHLLEKVKDESRSAWNDWLLFTHQQLDAEMCDCYRYWTKSFKWYQHCENRYYFDKNYHVAFITKFGGNPFHGHVSAREVFSSYGINQTKSYYKWSYATWADLVDRYISQWNTKPDVLLFNQGHWKGHELRDVKVLEELKKSLKKHNIRGIYRTTTYRQDERAGNEEATIMAFAGRETRKHDAVVCQYFECLNVSWTAGVSTDNYVDPVHFKASVNNRMNMQFFDEFVRSQR